MVKQHNNDIFLQTAIIITQQYKKQRLVTPSLIINTVTKLTSVSRHYWTHMRSS